MSQGSTVKPSDPALDVRIGPQEALSTAIFAIALPVAAFVEATYLGSATAGLSAALLIGAATTLSGVYVYGRIASMAREMEEATEAVRRLAQIGDKTPAPAPRAWMSKSEPGLMLSEAVATAAFKIDQRIDSLEARTSRDIETGLLNADGLRAEIAVEINRARRAGFPVTLGLIDIDNFDRYVGERGSIAAGAAVNTAARIIGEKLRNYDRIARRDASSFLLLMPGAGPETAMEALRRVRDEIERALGLPDGVSAGLALLDKSDKDSEPILRRADEMLRQLRLSGGARSVEAA